MKLRMTDADKGILDYASCAIGLALAAPVVLRRLRTRWVSSTAVPYKIQDGSQS
jgi:hypothetical protein